MFYSVLAIGFSSSFVYIMLQQVEGTSWQDVFKIVIILTVAALGSPITQWIKNGLGAITGKPVEDRWALVLTGVIAAVIAVLELWLSNILVFSNITIDTFPNAFTLVMTASTIYFGWLKGSESFFGQKALLKERKFF